MPTIAALAAAYVLSQFYRSFLAVLTPALTSELGATKADLSLASGMWFLAFALMQFGVGVWLDRYGPKRTASLMLGICGAAGALVFAGATAPWMITLGMVLFGIACAPVLMSAYFVFAKTWSPARFAVLASWMLAFGSLGNVVGAAPLAAAVETFGWRPVMAGLGIVTVLVAFALHAFVSDPPASEDHDGGGLAGYGELLRLKALWPILPMIAINYTAAAGIRGLWAGPYLADVHGADAIAIGNATLFMALAMVAGSFLYGPLDTLFNTRKWVVLVGNVIGVSAVATLALQPSMPVVWATVTFCVIGLFGMSFGLMMAHGRAFIPLRLTGRGVTLMNFFSIGGVAVMQVATGRVYEATAVAGNPAAGYAMLFGFYIAMFAIALIIYLFSRDATPKAR